MSPFDIHTFHISFQLMHAVSPGHNRCSKTQSEPEYRVQAILSILDL